MFDYYMSRYSTDMLYSFEFVFIVLLGILLIIFMKKFQERNSLFVYGLTGLLHSIIELVAEGTGVRVISKTYLFGTFYLSYPFLPFILGFFEGGFYCLVAYHFVRMIINRDSFSRKFFFIFTILFAMLSTLGALGLKTGVTTFTRRAIFHPGILIFLAICYTFSISYFLLKKRVTSTHRRSFLAFYIGLIFITLAMVLPLHLLGVRFIEVYQGGSYVYASLFEQIIVLYGYSLALEAAGYFLPFYVIIYHFKLIQFNE
ncbi:MAG: hypothetical protein ACTSRS_07120 [Candidatus Helarchaeota archaeon]